jgi:hypothetical protein
VRGAHLTSKHGMEFLREVQGGRSRMSIKKKVAAFLLASVAMLGVSGCYHHHHYDDHHPPPPGMDHDHDHDH